MKQLTKVQFLALACLARCPMHPYAIRQEIIELTDHSYYPAYSTVQQTIKTLASVGLIEECSSNPHYWLKAKRSVPYELTILGKQHLDKEASVYLKICQVIRMRQEDGSATAY